MKWLHNFQHNTDPWWVNLISSEVELSIDISPSTFWSAELHFSLEANMPFQKQAS